MARLPAGTAKAASLKAGLVGAGIDAATSVWTHRTRLRDPRARKPAIADVAWESGEGAVKGVAYVGTGTAVTIAIGMAEGATFAGAAILSTSAVTVGAPVVAGVAVTWVAGKAVQAARRRIGT